MSDLIQYGFLIIVGILAGAINTLAGGGSLLTLPILIFIGLPPNVANATNRIGIVFQAFVEPQDIVLREFLIFLSICI